MNPINVLIVDDSPFIRKVLSDLLGREKDIRVIDTARTGVDALTKIQALKPDVVTLDVEMPVMNGLEVLVEIMKVSPLPVIMLSSLTHEGSTITLEALSRGAFDFVAKPTLNTSLYEVITELCEKIRAARIAKLDLHISKPTAADKIIVKNFSQAKVVSIGSSTGGPRALEKILVELPAEFPVPIIITQHMPAGFTKSYAERVNNNCKIQVEEARDGATLKKGSAYIAPGNYHMTIKKGGVISLNQAPPVEHVRPSIDVMLNSAIDLYAENIIGVILTGMGKDGADAMVRLNKLGGMTIVQDEATSVIYGMPKAVVQRNAADMIVPIQDISGILEASLMSYKCGSVFCGL